MKVEITDTLNDFYTYYTTVKWPENRKEAISGDTDNPNYLQIEVRLYILGD